MQHTYTYTHTLTLTQHTHTHTHHTGYTFTFLVPLFLSSDPSVLANCTFESEEEEEVLMTNIKHRLTPHPVKIRAGM